MLCNLCRDLCHFTYWLCQKSSIRAFLCSKPSLLRFIMKKLWMARNLTRKRSDLLVFHRKKKRISQMEDIRIPSIRHHSVYHDPAKIQVQTDVPVMRNASITPVLVRKI